jgi:hypothetical protein
MVVDDTVLFRTLDERSLIEWADLKAEQRLPTSPALPKLPKLGEQNPLPLINAEERG